MDLRKLLWNVQTSINYLSVQYVSVHSVSQRKSQQAPLLTVQYCITQWGDPSEMTHRSKTY